MSDPKFWAAEGVAMSTVRVGQETNRTELADNEQEKGGSGLVEDV